MIYVRTKYDWMCEDTNIIGVYQVGCNDVYEKYKSFMLDKASELNLKINPHYLNVMDYENNNTHLARSEYDYKFKQWQKILRMWNIDKYICDVLKGVKVEYKVL